MGARNEKGTMEIVRLSIWRLLIFQRCMYEAMVLTNEAPADYLFISYLVLWTNLSSTYSAHVNFVAAVVSLWLLC